MLLFEGKKNFIIPISVSGIICLSLAILVLIGWYIKNEVLVQILPAFAPMQYNTALGFLLCGLSLLAPLFNQPKILLSTAGLCALLGLMTLLEYIFDFQLGIDELFMRHDITTQTSHPGRMAPNTALCFVLSGAAFILSTYSKNASRNAGVIGSFVFGLGMVAFLGYLIGNEATYGWGKLTRMAVHTAFGFIVVGTGLSLNSWMDETQRNKTAESLLRPWLVGYAVTFALTVFLIDVSFPKNVVEDGLYIGLVLFGWIIPIRRITLVLALIATLLSLGGFLLSTPTEIANWVFILNRIIALLAIWTVAILLDNIKRKDEALKLAKADLDKKIVEQIARNKELEQFAYIASHDMQEPMRTISSFTDLLAKRYTGQLDETGNKSLHFLQDASKRMEELNKGLLDYSRIGRKKTITNCDCNELISSLLEDLELQIKNANASITVKPLPVISCYKHELKLLFQHLIINAIKFRHPDRAPHIVIKAKIKDGEVTFCVADNGIGIAKEHFEKIFVIFQRLHARDAYAGTGVGLAQCQKIVEIHDGKITLESALNKGTTFFITLPV